MDAETIIAIIGGVVAVASALTNILPTPASDANVILRYGYQVIEFLALVGSRTKEHPDAAKAALAAFQAAQKGDIATAASEAAVAYQGLSKQSAVPPAAIVLMAIMPIGLYGCTSDGQLSPNVQKIVTAACQIDAAVAPALVKAGSVVTTVIAPELAPAVAAADAADQIAHQAVQNACAALGGTPVSVTTSTVATAPVAK